MHACAELLPDGLGARVSRELAVAGNERALLFARCFDELLYETQDLCPKTSSGSSFQRGLRAMVRSYRGGPRHVVTGVTQDRLIFERGYGGFRARVVLGV